MASKRRRLPPGAKWVELPSGERRVELVIDIGVDPATGKRKQARRRFVDEDTAIDAYAKFRTEVRNGTFVGRSTLTLAQACDDWLAGRLGIRKTTLAGYRHALKPVISSYGALPVQKLTKRNIDDLVAQLLRGQHKRADGRKARKWKPRTVNLMLFTLGKVLDSAMKQGELTRNVAALVDRMPQTKFELSTYTPSEVRRVLSAARSDRFEVAWHLALYGLRRGEIAGLRWSRVDLKANTLTVRRTRVVVDGEAEESDPKSASGDRTLPLTVELAKAFKRAKKRQAAEQLKAGELYEGSGFVIVDELGRAVKPEIISARWDVLARKADVPRIRLHDARHTAATLMHLQGVPIAVISAWIGHADPAFTMRTYVHHQPDALSTAAAALGTVTSM